MLIRETTWAKIREQFTEDEKQQLRDASNGQTICPPGTVVDEDRLGAELREKLKRAKATV
jgi:hypothetical protein